MPQTQLAAVKALFFDVFGTLVDWRTSSAREAKAVLEPLGHKTDWLGFAVAWLDVLHRRNLDRILPRFGFAGLSEDVTAHLNRAWHRLDAWPDVAPGLQQLRRRFLLAPVSNGNISLMVDLARRNSFPWDAILGAEIAGDYKPKPRVYLAAAEALDLAPGACMMVATAHIARPDEKGPGKGEAAPSAPVDVAVGSLMELADRLAA